MSQILVGGGPKHVHYAPSGRGFEAFRNRWNTVARSDCGHLYVRRYTWFARIIPLSDHYPIWVRLRPWHVVACYKTAWRWITP